MNRYDEARDRAIAGLNEAWRAICSLSIGDIDGAPRAEALELIAKARETIREGINAREHEAAGTSA